MKLKALLPIWIGLANPAFAAVDRPHAETPAAERAEIPTAPLTLTIDASDKQTFQYYSLQAGELLKTDSEGDWIFAVRRYIFQTPTGSNGAFKGGAYAVGLSEFESFHSCSADQFVKDEVITVLGYTISANTVLSNWYDYADDGSLVPLSQFYAIGRGSNCLKLKIKSYSAGIYELEYQQIP